MEILDDVYEWDDSPTAKILLDFINGQMSNSELHTAISKESWYQVEPGSDSWEEGSYWVRPEQTLGLSPARPYLPTGNEMPPIPSFTETDSEGRVFAKIFPPLFPKNNNIEPFVSNVQTFDVHLYNHFVDVFNTDNDLNHGCIFLKTFQRSCQVPSQPEQSTSYSVLSELDLNDIGQVNAPDLCHPASESRELYQDLGYFHLKGENVCTVWAPLDHESLSMRR